MLILSPWVFDLGVLALGIECDITLLTGALSHVPPPCNSFPLHFRCFRALGRAWGGGATVTAAAPPAGWAAAKPACWVGPAPDHAACPSLPCSGGRVILGGAGAGGLWGPAAPAGLCDGHRVRWGLPAGLLRCVLVAACLWLRACGCWNAELRAAAAGCGGASSPPGAARLPSSLRRTVLRLQLPDWRRHDERDFRRGQPH